MRVFWFSTTFRIEKEKVAEEEDERKKVLQGKLEASIAVKTYIVLGPGGTGP